MLDLKRIDEYMTRVEQSEKTTFRPATDKLKIGVDLGTAYIVIVVLDEDNHPVACEKKTAHVLKDGIVVDFLGAQRIVKELKRKLENRLGRTLTHCAIAMPAGTQSSAKTHVYVAEGAGFDVVNILDEPTAANSVFKINDGVVVDIGGGTTGLAVFNNGKVSEIEDEPTGGTHLTLVLSGNMNIPFDEAEQIKLDYNRHSEIFPIIKAVLEKMSSIVNKYIDKDNVDAIYLCGGTCCFTGIEKVFEKETGIKTIKPQNPFLITPAGIAMNCESR